MNQKRKGCCFVLFFFPFTLLLGIILTLFATYFITKPKYEKWETKFEENKISKDYHYIKNNNNTKTKESINKKSQVFNQSNKVVDYVEFNIKESAYLFAVNLTDSLPKHISVNKLFIESENLKWKIFVQLKYKDIELPWISFKLEKPDQSGIKLKIQELKIGPWSLKDSGLYFIEGDLQEGLDYAIELIENNRFTGRELENIELTEDKFIIKGNLYPKEN